MGPNYRKYIWWKKYLTSLQMVQFVVVILHALTLFVVEDCGFPPAYGYIIMGEAAMFLVLFSRFYQSSYKQKSLKKGKILILKSGSSPAKNIGWAMCSDHDVMMTSHSRISPKYWGGLKPPSPPADGLPDTDYGK